MRSYLLGAWAAALLALALGSAPAAAQQPTPPQVPLWRMEANGDAVQTDLGFVLPARFRNFERKGFTSTRPDGGSVMTWYETPDGLQLRILLQLRVDVRGLALPGADGVARNWPLLKIAGAAQYFGRPRVEPEQLAERPVVWGGGERPNGMMQLMRYPFPEGAEVQGLWYRNIGMWAVVVIAGGPEARRTEVEGAGEAVMNEMRWPRAPLGAELRAIQPSLLRDLGECRDLDRGGSGRPFAADATTAALIGTTLIGHFVDHFPGMPHPARDASPYCRIERIRLGGRELVALAWRGDAAAAWQARWAFMVVGTGTLYQFESPLGAGPPPGAAAAAGVSRLVQLTVSSERGVIVRETFTDWPSYAEAKAAVTRSIREGGTPLVQAFHPPGNMVIQVGGQAPQPAPERPAPVTP